MKNNKREINSYRYERKFNIPKHLASYSLALIRSNFSNLSELYEERQVNSLYYDTYNLNFARQNLNGNSNRKKIRLRYYGDQKILKDPQIEIKSKFGHVGTKKVIEINKNTKNKNKFYSFEQLNNIYSLDLNQDTSLIGLRPVLFVSYLRKYFISKCNRFRFTLDENIVFKAIDFTLNEDFIIQKQFFNANESILEIKYNFKDEINELINSLNLPFRISRYSKYIIGLSVTGKLKI